MHRDFKGIWIPREVWLDDRLNALDKIILAEIDSLDVGENGCYASNEYLAEFCQCSRAKITATVSKLIELGYIYTYSFDGRQRILKSRLLKFSRQTTKICEADYQNLGHINIIDNNNTDNIKKERKTSSSKSKNTNYDNIISGYTEDTNLTATIYDYIKMRQMIKAPLTDRALELCLKKLDTLSSGDTAKKIAILEQSIANSWKGVFPLKDNNTSWGGSNRNRKEADVYDDYDAQAYEQLLNQWNGGDK